MTGIGSKHRRRAAWKLRSAAAIAIAVLAVLTSGPAATASSTVEGVPHMGHVFLIIGENTTYSHLTATNAPYLMTNLRPRSAWLTARADIPSQTSRRERPT